MEDGATLATIWEVPDHLWEQIHPVVKGGAKLYHLGVVGQGKCQGKCSAKMSLRYAAMVSDVDGLGTIRCFHPGGPPASR